MEAAILERVALESVRALFVLGLPIVAAVALGGLLVAALQGATSIRDNASAYAIRLLAFVIAFYFVFPLYSRTLTDLLRAVMG
jgi:type III secretory pathway component EscS